MLSVAIIRSYLSRSKVQTVVAIEKYLIARRTTLDSQRGLGHSSLSATFLNKMKCRQTKNFKQESKFQMISPL